MANVNIWDFTNEIAEVEGLILTFNRPEGRVHVNVDAVVYLRTGEVPFRKWVTEEDITLTEDEIRRIDEAIHAEVEIALSPGGV